MLSCERRVTGEEPPVSCLEQLTGDRAGQWSARANDQFRTCFRWTGSDAERRRDRGLLLRQDEMTRKLKPVSPGEMLAEEFLKPLGMSNYRLAKEIGVPAQRIGEIVAGKRAITADTDLRLCRFFGLSDGWWLRLQADFDTEVGKASLAKALAKIRPWKEAAEQTADAH
jgi:addiction module HigA family antidote